MNDRDVTHRKLRHAVRLVHCLQKERGASASYFSHQISNALPAPPAPVATGIGALLEAEENMNQKDSSKEFLKKKRRRKNTSNTSKKKSYLISGVFC